MDFIGAPSTLNFPFKDQLLCDWWTDQEENDTKVSQTPVSLLELFFHCIFLFSEAYFYHFTSNCSKEETDSLRWEFILQCGNWQPKAVSRDFSTEEHLLSCSWLTEKECPVPICYALRIFHSLSLMGLLRNKINLLSYGLVSYVRYVLGVFVMNSLPSSVSHDASSTFSLNLI